MKKAYFSELFAEHNFKHYKSNVGFFSMNNLSYANVNNIFGIGIKPNLDSLKNDEKIRTNPINIYLPTKSTIIIFRDDIIMNSKSYNAGHHIIDTSSLP